MIFNHDCQARLSVRSPELENKLNDLYDLQVKAQSEEERAARQAHIEDLEYILVH